MWSLLNNNIYCAEKEQLRNNQIHFEKLLCTKARVNNKGNEMPFFLKNKSYLRELIRTRERTINVINNMMNKKLKSVAKSPSSYSKYISTPKYCPAFDRKRFNFSRVEQERKIYSENKSFYKRFMERKPTYSTKNLLKKSNYEQNIRNSISRGRYLQKFSLKLCTYREFKSNLMKMSSYLRDKIESLNDTCLSDNCLKTNSIEYSNSFNNDLYFSSNNNNSLSMNNFYNKKPKFKIQYDRKEINGIKLKIPGKK